MSPRKREGRQTLAELKSLQRWMGAALMRRLTGDGGMQGRWADGKSMRETAAVHIRPNAELSSFERLELYNRQYWFRLIDAFYEDYPGLRAVLGARAFDRLTVAYLERHPSESFTLRNLGRALAGFLADNPTLTRPRTRLALDMARLEWAHIEAFDNEALPPVDVNQLLGRDPGSLRLKLQAHLSLLELEHPLDHFLIEVRKGGDSASRGEASNAVGEAPARAGGGVWKRPPRERVFLAVHRHDNTVYYRRLAESEHEILKALGCGETLEEACVMSFDEEVYSVETWSERVKDWFEAWTSLGWFCGVLR